METKIFHWGGNLDPSSPVYVVRPEDAKLAEHIAVGDFVSIIAARQMGKTSMLLRTRKLLSQAGMAIAYIDLSPAREESLQGWYGYLAKTINEQLLNPADAPPLPNTHLEFMQYIRAAATLMGNKRFCIMLDEIGAVPPELSDAFFGNVRYVFSNRQVKPELRYTNFVLCGTFQSRNLIRNPANSPFNISKNLRPSDFSRDGVKSLVSQLERLGIFYDDDIPDEVYSWTAGQPYLTQRLCSIFEDWKIPISGPNIVERAAQEIMAEDNNLDHIVSLLNDEPELVPWLERILIHHENIRFNRMTNQRLARLELLGLIKPGTDGMCKVKNKMYQALLIDNFFAESVSNTVPDTPISTEPAAVSASQEVTALSIDIVNSTIIKQGQDRVAVSYTFQQYYQYIQNLSRRWGGRIKDSAGDGIMCIFSSADSALSCAREIQDNMPGFNHRHNRLDMPVEVRVGLNTGQVLLRNLEDYRMTSQLYDITLDLSGKLQKGINAGEIAITNYTMQRLKEPVPATRQEFWPEYNITVYVV